MLVKILKVFCSNYDYYDEQFTYQAQVQNWEEVSEEECWKLQEAVREANAWIRQQRKFDFTFVLVAKNESKHEAHVFYEEMQEYASKFQEALDKQKEKERKAKEVYEAKKKEKALERKRKQLEKLKKELETD